MKKSSQKTCLHLLSLLVLSGMFSCTHIDMEYARRLPNARTDCTGNEIVGVWVSQPSYARKSRRYTLLLRPDGTGIGRDTSDVFRERRITWQYTGRGVWQHQQGPRSGPIHYDGQCLLLESRALDATHDVYVRADDEAAVEKHLNRR
ncbi:hypothetical protein [Prosthecobacter sp.]|uniref:hypothetical protein n=1 Tax=Prosthecobacter sp. TaxID=1965333 RepID=UPI003783B7C9